MAVLRRRDTAPEIAVRRLLHARGLRYRVAYPVPGMRRRTIDVAFPGQRVAVFIDGCFWHGCAAHGTQPRSNESWWTIKLRVNRERDESTTSLLESGGWTVLRFWEHEAPEDVAVAVGRAVAARR